MLPQPISPADAFRNLATSEITRNQVHQSAREGYAEAEPSQLVDAFKVVEATIRYRYDIFDTSSATTNLGDVNIPLAEPPANLTSALVNAWRRRKE